MGTVHLERHHYKLATTSFKETLKVIFSFREGANNGPTGSLENPYETVQTGCF